jgi:hypothetical protein
MSGPIYLSNPRSGCQHKAWGVSPRYASGKETKPAEWAAAEDTATMINVLTHVACWIPSLPLGVLYCYRPLRGLDCLFGIRSWGLRPRLYADVRSADYLLTCDFAH